MGRKRLPQRGKRYAYLPYRSSRGRRLRRALTTIVELLTPRCRMGRFWIRIFLVGYLAKTIDELQPRKRKALTLARASCLVARPRRLERLTSTFGGLHSIQTELRAQRIQCMVPKRGFEPLWNYPLAPETSASTVPPLGHGKNITLPKRVCRHSQRSRGWTS